MSTVLGLDMGGSRTRALVVRDGETEAEAFGFGTNITALGSAEVGRRLAVVLTDLGHPNIDACCAGAAGSEQPRARAQLEALLVEFLPGARVEVVHDSRLVLAAANVASGVALVAGTGSVAWGRTQTGEEVRAGGWGWLLGDDGGGAWVVREAMRVVMRRADDGMSAGPLGASLLSATGTSDAVALAAALHLKAEPQEWAALAGAVFRAGAADQDALAIIERAANSLADMAIRVAERLGNSGPIVLAGGLLLNQPLLESAVRARLHERGLRVHRLDVEPVVGAARLATQLLAAKLG